MNCFNFFISQRIICLNSIIKIHIDLWALRFGGCVFIKMLISQHSSATALDAPIGVPHALCTFPRFISHTNVRVLLTFLENHEFVDRTKNLTIMLLEP